MPRRAVLSEEQRAALLALPDDEALLVQHWTLSHDDLAVIVRRRPPHNRLGFAIQLCALRYPGRLLRPGELIPATLLAFVAGQLKVAPEVLADYATRGPTRYEQLDALRDAFGFSRSNEGMFLERHRCRLERLIDPAFPAMSVGIEWHRGKDNGFRKSAP